MIKPELKDAIRADLVDAPLLGRLGMEPGDMHGVVARANAKLAQGDALGAFADFAGLVLMDPTDVGFQIGLAESAIGSDQAELGLQAAAIIITEAPDKPEGFFLSGKACLAMDERELAAEDLRDAIARCEGRPNAAALLKSARHLLSIAEAG